ncbi:fatty acid cis/trans isomerase [Rubellicoccus peritrichatus]|uniref:Fatty acid cis/trans isomerase n=1 Tax=Rubellicoccus peritrichatus TaxID=3080537 RepID=A0AAQ3QXY4_9BACT|nr:fatty acid cis/trans isomerase [Puniceicoccus sp. CR14]WOO43532.1 fatty acid cis/trans isomerase [Puniceicoccus sp. CR14]
MKHPVSKALGGILAFFVLLVSTLVLLYNFGPDFKPKWDPYVHKPVNEAKVISPRALENDVYLSQIQPIFDSRCIACHGCLNSPCLLKLTSYEGLARGARSVNPDGIHLFPERPVRLIDEPNVAAWRKRGFFPVVNPKAKPDERLAQSNLYRMVMAGVAHNQGTFPLKPVEAIHAKENNHTCANPSELTAWLNKNPGAGMPFALPPLNTVEVMTITDWIKDGSPGPSPEAQAALEHVSIPTTIARWEEFLNQGDPRVPLVSRYIFEHTFLAAYNFSSMPNEFFRMVRSATPPGKPIEEIVTSRPFDDPFFKDNVTKVYYRFQKMTGAVVQKSFFVWEVNDTTLHRLNELFLKPSWGSNPILNPGYASHNPFEVFRSIPAKARAQFLFENSKLIVSGMIQGPVCVGNLATYAIKDYFWAYFVKPESDPTVLDPELGMKSWDDFMNYTVSGNTDYEKAYESTLYKYKPEGYSVSDIWNGDRTNPNAWLTILRNETNATVVHGRKGGIPPTFWLVDFSGLERLYYSLVADYTYWGSTKEKLQTWTFMGFLRQEFEDNFLRLLPPQDRQQYRDKWTKGIGQELLFTMPFPGEDSPSAIKLDSQNPMNHLLSEIQAHMGPKVSGPPDPLNPAQTSEKITLPRTIPNKAAWEKAVAGLTMRTHQGFTPFLPSLTHLRINNRNEDWVYTIVANRSYAFNDVVFDENGARQPKLDTMSVYESLIGDFPNLYVEIELKEALPMLAALSKISNQEDWNAWKTRYGKLRNQPDFWKTYDWFTEWNYANREPNAGHYDLTYYDFLDSGY